MTGMERNSDIVVMASYAPLLVNVDPGGMQWETDLIGYNAMKSYGSPSYYAQVMFASYLGDHTLGVGVERREAQSSSTRSPENTAKKQLYLKLVNASSTPQSVEIDLTGAKLAKTAKLVSLSAHDTQATNTIDDPEHVVPVESTLNDVSNHVRHTLPGYSIQVIEFNEE